MQSATKTGLEPASAHQVAPKSALIVDDNPNIRKVVHDIFGLLPEWKVAGEAANGATAIEKATEIKPDLVLLDLSMPHMNGVEAASVLKKMLPAVRIVAFTWFEDSLGSRLRSAVGVDLVISKAEGLSGLVKAVRSLI